MTRQLLTLAAALLASLCCQGQEQLDWLRASSIAPDGQTIAFEYQGDIYTVSADGGEAHRLTTHSAYDGHPHFSPDGKWIAFTSDRAGGMDVYITTPQGGKPRRLTTHSGGETIQGWLDNDHILFSAQVMPDVKDISYPGTFQQVYSVDLEGGRPVMFSTLPMEDISINARGELLYHNNKGYEDHWRKHHQSPICRDIYLTQVKGKRTYRKLNSDMCEHRTPVWAPDGQNYYYTSESDGTLNIYKASASGGTATQITHYKDYPVRYLTSSADGLLCYSWDGALYTLREGGKPRKLTVSVTSDDEWAVERPTHYSSGASDMATNKNEEEFAFVAKGEIYVTNMDYSTTRRITNTVETEKQPSLSPDGRTLIYASERNGTWDIYATTLTNDKDKGFTYATDIEETPLIAGSEAYTRPVYSPDGTMIAYLANKTEIRVYDVKSKKSHVVLPATNMFSYTDDTFTFEWSPDSKWILSEYLGQDNWISSDIAIMSADGKEVHNLTRSGYADSKPHWAMGGKAVIFISDRAGYRSHGSWGAERDGYIMYLDREAYALSRMDKEERKLYEERKKEAAQKGDDKDKKDTDKDKKDADKDKKDADNKDKNDSIAPLKLWLADCDKRVQRLTMSSSNIQDAHISPDGRKYYYVMSSEGSTDLWVRDMESRSSRVLKRGFGNMQFFPDKKGESLFACNGTLSKVSLGDGSSKSIPFSAEYTYTYKENIEYEYNHIVSQIETRFADTGYNGIDFEQLADHYHRFVPHINNYRDFAEMASELMGELNYSHSGVKYQGGSKATATAVLGAFYDNAYEGDGLKIVEILRDSPLDVVDSTIKAGHIIMQIDHQPIKAGQDYYPLLENKGGKELLLTIADEKGATYETHVKATSQGKQNDMLYDRWVEQRAAIVERETQGRVGYVHIKSMNSQSYRQVYSDVLGKYRDCQSLIIDERNNGGGWLHNDLAILFGGQQYMSYVSRGQKLGIEPFTQWTKPSCVLVSENCYSNASGFPYAYQTLGIGKLIGTPVAGTMTAVWWEKLSNGVTTLGIPEILCLDTNGQPLENHNITPDIEVYNSPEDVANGYDRQLMRAIEEMK